MLKLCCCVELALTSSNDAHLVPLVVWLFISEVPLPLQPFISDSIRIVHVYVISSITLMRFTACWALHSVLSGLQHGHHR